MKQASSWMPFTDFSVKDSWITSLVVSNKVSSSDAIQLYLQCMVRCDANVRLLNYRQEMMRQHIMEQQRIEVEATLRQQQKPFKRFVQVEKWLEQYSHIRGRYKFLVLDGASQTGKTKFAFSLVPPNACYYCDCSGKGIPDLRKFDWSVHEMVVLDEMGPAGALACKKSIQASNEPCTMGTSPTLQHSYSVYVWRTKFVISTNTWHSATALKGMSAEDKDWLLQNAVVVHVDAPMWQ